MTRISIGTYLRPDQRQAIESAADDIVTLIHCANVRDLVTGSASGHLSAVLVSAERVEAPDIRALTAFRTDFPTSEIVGVTTDGSVQGVLRLGRAGLSRVVDMRMHAGPGLLRSMFDGLSVKDSFGRDAVRILLDGVQCKPSFAREIALAFDLNMRTMRRMAERFGMSDSTLSCRHHRAGVPSPKDYIAHAQVAWAAHYGESRGLSSVQIAQRINMGSPTSFGRFIRLWAGCTPAELHAHWTGERYVRRMREAMIDPYLAEIREFDPTKPASFGHHRPRLALVADVAA